MPERWTEPGALPACGGHIILHVAHPTGPVGDVPHRAGIDLPALYPTVDAAVESAVCG